MRLRDAKRLHNGDHVIFKPTKEVGRVIGEPIHIPIAGKYCKWVNIFVLFPCLGLKWVAHDEVK